RGLIVQGPTRRRRRPRQGIRAAASACHRAALDLWSRSAQGGGWGAGVESAAAPPPAFWGTAALITPARRAMSERTRDTAVAVVVACPARFAAAVDSEPRYCDVAEATKVRLDGRRLIDLGRGLERFDAVDAGMFICDADLLSVAERALAQGDGSWNAVKRR